MNNTIPGTVAEDGREFFYAEAFHGEGFDEIVDGALAACPDVPIPNDGGVIEEKARVLIQGRRSLLAMSYRGDLAGWRAKLVSYCKATGRMWGIANNQRLELSDGSELPLEKCDIVFEP